MPLASSPALDHSRPADLAACARVATVKQVLQLS